MLANQALIDQIRDSTIAYAASLAVVAAAVFVGAYVLKPGRLYRPVQRYTDSGVRFVDSFARWDTEAYLAIAMEGYQYHPQRPSRVVYFPAFPLLIRAVSSATGIRPIYAALALAHVCLIATIVLFRRYVELRLGRREAVAAMILFALYPAGMFLRMAYTESFFTLLTIGVLLAIHHRRSVAFVCLLCGVAAATRPTGLGLAVVGVTYCLSVGPSPIWRRVLRLTWAIPLSTSGLLAYMLYLQYAFGDPLVFASSQQPMFFIAPTTVFEKAMLLSTGWPVVASYCSDCVGNWAQMPSEMPWFVNIQFFNAITWTFALAASVYGAIQGWLNRYEIGVAATFLLIPYISRGYEAAMLSQARYTCVALPLFIVLARMLEGRSRAVRWTVVGVCVCYLAVFAATFAAGHLVI